jgi:hypothetical protein
MKSPEEYNKNYVGALPNNAGCLPCSRMRRLSASGTSTLSQDGKVTAIGPEGSREAPTIVESE